MKTGLGAPGLLTSAVLGWIVLSMFLVVPVSAAAGPDDLSTIPFILATPEGWREETIEFPLSFAPQLKYQGVEELRFAPGMFTEESEDFWTYAFGWWISDRSSIEPDGLETDLKDYFEGLARVVAEEGRHAPGGATAGVKLSEADLKSEHGPDFIGTASVFDAFVTGKMILLNIRVKKVHCSGVKRLAVLFEMSPQPYTHQIWSTLKGIREEFRCPDSS